MRKPRNAFTLFLAGASLVLSSCASAPLSFHLSFMVEGAVYATVETRGNEVISMPKDPVKEGYSFEGWYWDEGTWLRSFTARSLLDTPLSSDLSVYAYFLDDSALKGAEIRIAHAERDYLEGVGEAFFLTIPADQAILRLTEYVEVAHNATWFVSTDIGGRDTIPSRVVELFPGDNPLLYLHVSDDIGNIATYILSVHRNRIFTVTFDTIGGDYCPPRQVEEGYLLEDIPITAKRGYDFLGWDYDFAVEPIMEDLTVTAIYEAKRYTVSYRVDDGEIDHEEESFYFDGDYRFAIPEKRGYTFKGYRDPSGSEVPLQGTWTWDHDLVLTAVYEPIRYAISYEFDGGTLIQGTLPDSYTVEDEFTLPSLMKTGHTFLGWARDSYYATPEAETRVSKGTIGDLRFYAKWQTNVYSIYYDVAAGDPLQDESQEVRYGERYTLAEPTREGYRFDGWYEGEDPFISGTYEREGDVHLTARWSVLSYPIQYRLNGGNNAPENPTTYTIENEDIYLFSPSKKGHSFLGWSSFDGETPQIEAKIPAGSVGEKTFIANWKANEYTITYHPGDGVMEAVSQTVTFGESFALPVAQKEGHYFAYWQTIEGKIVEDGVYEKDHDLDLYAVYYEEGDYAVMATLDLSGGTMDGLTTIGVKKNKDTLPVPNSFSEAYRFAGWKYDGKMITGSDGVLKEVWNHEATEATFTAVFARSISTLAELSSLSAKGYGILTADLDASGESMHPMKDFSGSLFGDGHAISRIKMKENGLSSVGLFSSISSGSVYDLTLVLPSFEITSPMTGDVSIGCFAGKVNGAYFENCAVIAPTVVATTRSSSSNAGGIAGEGQANFVRCREEGAASYVANFTGGILGKSTGASTLERCVTSGSLAAVSDTDNVNNNVLKAVCGGFVGTSSDGGLSFATCVNGANVSLAQRGKINGAYMTATGLGGFLGYARDEGEKKNATIVIEDSVNDGEVSSEYSCSGFIGRVFVYRANYSIDVSIEDSVNNGNILTSGGGAGFLGSIYPYAYSSSTGSARFVRCQNRGDILASDSAAGICAATSRASVSFEQCQSLGSLSVKDYAYGMAAGGMLGSYDSADVTVKNCYASAPIFMATPSGSGRAGGLVGGYFEVLPAKDCHLTIENSIADTSISCLAEENANGQTPSFQCAGLVGVAQFATIKNSYASGTIYGTKAGDLIAAAKDGDYLNNCSTCALFSAVDGSRLSPSIVDSTEVDAFDETVFEALGLDGTVWGNENGKPYLKVFR